MDKRRLIAMVHIAKKDLALDDETYRHMLKTVGGQASCGDMTLVQLEKVLTHLKQKGWKPKRGKRTPPDRVDKIQALWKAMHADGITQDGSDAALDKFVQRVTTQKNQGAGVARLAWLRGQKPELQQTVLESLKQWQKRVLKTRASHD